jgi:hypothetical protein
VSFRFYELLQVDGWITAAAADISFTAFWWKTITVGPWPSGPIWFVWVLLAFDLLACPLYPSHTGC